MVLTLQLLLLLASADRVLLIDLEGSSAQLAQYAQTLGTGDTEVLDHSSAWATLTGSPLTEQPPTDGLWATLHEARRLAARFDTQGAQALWIDLLETYEQQVWLLPQLTDLAASVLHDLAAAHLSEGNPTTAVQLAQTALCRFPSKQLDRQRYPPPVHNLFETAGQQLRESSQGVLVVHSEPGQVFADGHALGPTQGVLRRNLPTGTYRVWVQTEHGSSFAHTIDLDDRTEIAIAAEFESCLGFPPLTLRCPQSYATHLQMMRARLGVDRIVISTSDENLRPDEKLEILPRVAQPGFSALYLLPFGGAQFAQDRPVAGSLYLGSGIGLVTWHLIAISKHNSAVRRNDFDAEDSLRLHRNLSAGLLVGVGVATVLEAVIYALVFEDE